MECGEDLTMHFSLSLRFIVARGIVLSHGRVFMPGTLFGEECILTNATRQFDAFAITHCDLNVLFKVSSCWNQ